MSWPAKCEKAPDARTTSSTRTTAVRRLRGMFGTVERSSACTVPVKTKLARFAALSGRGLAVMTSSDIQGTRDQRGGPSAGTSAPRWTRSSGGCDAEREERRRDLLDDVSHLTVGWVERRRVIRAAPFDRVPVDLRQAGIDDVAAVGVVV